MSRYNPHLENTDRVYAAAAYWRDTCLLQDGSVFTDKKLWSRENLNDEFIKNLVACMFQVEIPDATSFMDKLVIQLKHVNTNPQTYQLMAEFLWVIYLATSGGRGGMKGLTKKKRIQRVWEESGENLPDHNYFQKEYTAGIAIPGMAFNNQIWRELLTLIFFVCQIKNLNDNECRALLANSDGKEIALKWEDWTEQWNSACAESGSLYAEHRQIRHILFHLLFPDHFERAFSSRPKRKIVKAFRGKEASKQSRPKLDAILREIRTEKEKEYGTHEIDFFALPLYRDWTEEDHPEKVDPVGEDDNPLGILLNRIFFGPPGTGKTYRTVEAALKILDPKFYEENSDERGQLRERYKQLIAEKQISFVTFHQSFGYEEFVEGIRPLMGEEEGEHVSYEIKTGVFKEICERAASPKPLSMFEDAIEKLKNECSEEPVEMKTVVHGNRHKVWHIEGNRSFMTQPLDVSGLEGVAMPVFFKWIRRFYEHPDKQGGVKPRMILKHLKQKYGLDDRQSTSEHKNYVLIIDEINRGNISRIFGELITLIEPSKRLGNDEPTEITLPYSGESFGVPNNLYIIGTMNTADRSIALLDTALRRRFRFEEMMPDYSILNDIEMDAVDVAELLKAMNERIEALYDRDHQIGHSYFLRLQEAPDMETLSDIFRYEILPLLQEYFYDDWEKIDAVLNSNGFLRPTSPAKIKRGDLIDDDKKLWSVDDDALNEIENYQNIYEGDGGDE